MIFVPVFHSNAEDHTEQLRGQTEPLRIPNTPQQLRDTNGKQLRGPHVNKGFPYMEDHTEQLRW